MRPALMIMDWTTEPVSQPQLNVVFIRVALVVVSLHSNGIFKTSRVSKVSMRATEAKSLEARNVEKYNNVLSSKTYAHTIQFHITYM